MNKCSICGVEYESIASLGKHVKGTHKISMEYYYVNILKNGVHYCVCGKPTKFLNLNLGFSKHCSCKCSYHDKEVSSKREKTCMVNYGDKNPLKTIKMKEKIKKTLLERYGTDNLMQIPGIRERIKKTNIEKYGCENSFQNKDIREKIKETNLKKYGFEHALQNKDVQQKSKDTCKKNFGCEYPAQNKEVVKKQQATNLEKYGYKTATENSLIKEKVRNTNIERYGYASPMQNEKVQAKAMHTTLEKYGVQYNGQAESAKIKQKETNLSKYGTEHVFQNEDVKDKIKATCIDTYGTENPMQCNEIKDKIKNTVNEKTKNIYKRKLLNFNCILENYSLDGEFTFTCNVCGHRTTESYQFITVCRLDRNYTPCTNCISKNEPTSFIEKELCDFIKTLSNDVVENPRDIIPPQEIDIYIPSLKLGFEFDGIHYHSELYKSNDYHLNKTEACDKKEIRLIHIFEDDWVYKKSIVKSRIRMLFGLSEKIYARKCELHEVSHKDSKIFLNDNHIQGYCISKYQYGLYYNNELVSLMTFGKSRFEKDKMELIRFCNKLNTTILGGASKIFQHFLLNNPHIIEIISYADRCWSNASNNLYKTLGFELSGITSPNYQYVVGNMRESRIKYQKHKLIAEGFDKNKTEHEIMLDRLIFRIYDCGNLKYAFNR